MNITLFLFIFAICLASIFVAYKFLGKNGLYYLLTIMTIVSFFLSFKIVNINGVEFNANVITSSSIFAIIIILLEKGKNKENHRIIETSIISIAATLMVILVSVFYIQSVNDTVSVDIDHLFIDNFSFLISYPIALLLSEYCVIKTYDFVKKESYDNMFIISGLMCLSFGLLYSIVVNFSGYYFTLTTKDIIRLILINYLVQILLTAVYSIEIQKLLTLKKVNYE